MSFAVITDTACNLPARFLREHDVTAIPFSYYVESTECTCPGPDEFDGGAYYEMLSKGGEVKTSLINEQRYLDHFEPLLAAGHDVLYVGMSGGISSSMQVARLTAHELGERYPARKIAVFDCMTASLGEAVYVRAAIRQRDAGSTLGETAAHLLQLRRHTFSFFTVDDLMFLRRGGRISNITAVVGTVLGVKPLLCNDEEGHIIVYGKTRGRKKALRALAEEFDRHYREHPDQAVAIAHGNCAEDAQYVVSLIREKHPEVTVHVEIYEPVTGSYVGPGTVALFFVGTERQ